MESNGNLPKAIPDTPKVSRASRRRCLDAPSVISFCYRNLEATHTTWKADCKACGKTIKDRSSTTSNFHRHLRTNRHEEVLAEYESFKQNPTAVPERSSPVTFKFVDQIAPSHAASTMSLSDRPSSDRLSADRLTADRSTSNLSQSILLPRTLADQMGAERVPADSSQAGKYTDSHPRQLSITKSLVRAVVDGSVDANAAESSSFSSFLQVLHPRYNLLSSSVINSWIRVRRNSVHSLLCSTLSAVRRLSVTSEMWLSRSGRYAYLAVGAHFLSPETHEFTHALLGCEEFFIDSTVSSAVTNASSKMLRTYDIQNKISYVVVDDHMTSPVRKEKIVSFPGPSRTGNSSVSMDNETVGPLAQSGPEDQSEGLSDWFPAAVCGGVGSGDELPTALECFRCALADVVSNGLKAVGPASQPIGMCLKLVHVLESLSNPDFNEFFEASCSFKSPVPTPNATSPWCSTVKLISNMLSLDQDSLNTCLLAFPDVGVTFNFSDWVVLAEVLGLFLPFVEAMETLESDAKSPSASFVLPCVLALESSLDNCASIHLDAVKSALVGSLREKFEGLFNMSSGILPNTISKKPFSSEVYLLSTVLDPNWSLKCIRVYRPTQVECVKSAVKAMLASKLSTASSAEPAQFTRNSTPASSVDGINSPITDDKSSLFQSMAPPCSGLFSKIDEARQITHPDGKLRQLESYFFLIDNENAEGCSHPGAFWEGHSQWGDLKELAMSYLCVPASCGHTQHLLIQPVEGFSVNRGELDRVYLNYNKQFANL